MCPGGRAGGSLLRVGWFSRRASRGPGRAWGGAGRAARRDTEVGLPADRCSFLRQLLQVMVCWGSISLRGQREGLLCHMIARWRLKRLKPRPCLDVEPTLPAIIIIMSLPPPYAALSSQGRDPAGDYRCDGGRPRLRPGHRPRGCGRRPATASGAAEGVRLPPVAQVRQSLRLV